MTCTNDKGLTRSGEVWRSEDEYDDEEGFYRNRRKGLSKEDLSRFLKEEVLREGLGHPPDGRVTETRGQMRDV